MTIQEENKLLKEHLRELIKAEGKMLDKWTDGDDAVKKDLWQKLHEVGLDAREFLLNLDKR